MRKLTIEEMREIAKSNGGICISNTYVNEKTKLKWQCSKCHVWKASPDNVKHANRWCPYCAGNVKLTIKDMKKLAEDKGGKCLSEKYKNLFSKLRWQCSKGHVWESAPSNVKHNNHWCPYCAGNAKHTIDVAKQIAEKRGGKCLSEKYKNANAKLKWQCSEGHVWEARLHDVKDDNNWCPHCSHRARLTIEEMRKIASSRGGKCLSAEYKNTESTLLWECEKGHRWSSRPSLIKRSTWCPHCAGNLKLTLEEMQKLAETKGGKCLSTEYRNVESKLTWQCKENHIWEARPSDIKHGQWCPTCSEGISERICRKYFEIIFGKKFPKIRPQWLVSSRESKLELDGYNKELGVAFEYQGVQHFKRIGKWSEKRTLERQQEDDEAKRTLCKSHKIILIEVPYTIKHREIGKYIINQCEINSITIPDKNISMDYKQFDIYSMTKTFLKELNEIAKSRSGLCLSTNYVSAKTKLEWQCKKGHRWFASPHHVKEGHWCPKCTENMRLTIEEMQESAKSRGGECLSNNYVNSHTNLKCCVA